MKAAVCVRVTEPGTESLAPSAFLITLSEQVGCEDQSTCGIHEHSELPVLMRDNGTSLAICMQSTSRLTKAWSQEISCITRMPENSGSL